MTAQVYQIRDFQSKKDLERMRQALEKEAAEIMSQIGPCETIREKIPYGGAGIDGMLYESSLGYVAPEKDPA